MNDVLSLTKDTSVLQHRGEISEVVSWKTTSACSKFSAAAAQLLLLRRCLNWGFCATLENEAAPWAIYPIAALLAWTQTSLDLVIGLISFRLVPMGLSACESTSWSHCVPTGIVFRKVREGDKSSLSHLDHGKISREGRLLRSVFDRAALIQRDGTTFFSHTGTSR